MTSDVAYLSVKQVAAALSCSIDNVLSLIETGALTQHCQGIALADVKRLSIYRAMLRDGPRVQHVEGINSTYQIIPDCICGFCQTNGNVVYEGSLVLDGSIELCHLMHTEVENYFVCLACKNKCQQLEFL